MLYVDTSVLVSALTSEADTERSQAWLADQNPDLLVVSDWVVTEFSSALSIKLRTGQIEGDQRARVLAAFTRLVADSFEVLPIAPGDFHVAARFADRHDLSLRAGDALHLSIASAHGATICTLDRRLAEAAVILGVDARQV